MASKFLPFVLFLATFAAAAADFQLPKVVQPKNYQVELQVDAGRVDFDGSVKILLDVLSETRVIYLNCKDLIFDSSSVKLDERNLASFSEDNETGICTFDFGGALPVGEYNFAANFKGYFGKEQKGLFIVEYELDNEISHYVATNFKPTFARSVFPCFDEPQYKSVITLTLTHDNKFNAISNMPVAQRTENAPFSTTVFQPTAISIPTYTLGFILTTLSPFNLPLIRTKIYAPSIGGTLGTLLTTRAVNKIESALSFYEREFTPKYPISKVDVVGAPEYNPMVLSESAGLSVFLDSDLIFAPQVISALGEQERHAKIYKQIGQAWFGDISTPEWWNHFWISEGITTYWRHKSATNWNFMDQFSILVSQKILDLDYLDEAQPLVRDVFSPNEILGYLSEEMAMKSAALFYMMENVIGSDGLKASLNEILVAGGTVNPDQLFAAMDRNNQVQLPATLTEIFNDWITKPGYPIIQVNRDYSSNTVTLTQNRYIEASSTVPNLRYYVPLSFSTAGAPNDDPSPTNWILPESDSLVLTVGQPSDWLLVNLQQKGYYRVLYDEENYKLLSQWLRTEDRTVIHPIDRAQLIDNADSFTREEQLSFYVLMDLIEAWETEEDYVPWQAATKAIDHIWLYTRGSEAFGRYETFLRSITEKIYGIVKLDGEDDHMTSLLRQSAVRVACLAGVKACVDRSVEIVNELIRDGINATVIQDLTPEMLSIVSCTISKYDDDTLNKIINFLLSLSENVDGDDEDLVIPSVMATIDLIDQNSIIDGFVNGFGCSRNEKSLKNILDISIVPGSSMRLNKKIRRKIFQSVVRRSYEGTRIALEFMEINFFAMRQRFDDLHDIFTEIGDYLVTQELNDLLDSILVKYSYAFLQDDLEAAIHSQNIGSKLINFVSKHVPAINAWLINAGYEGTTTTTKEPEGGGGDGASVAHLSGILLIFLALKQFI